MTKFNSELDTVTSLIKVRKWLVAGFFLWPALCPANYFGLPNARVESVPSDKMLGVDIGYAKGQFFTLDYQHVGVRLTAQVVEDWAFELDVGDSSLDRASGTSFGLAAVFQSNWQYAQLPAAKFKLSYHSVTAKRSGFSDYKPDVIAIEALLGRNSGFLELDHLGWYLNAGVHRFSDRVGSESEFGVGGGILMPIFGVKAYLGFDLIDNIQVGGGIHLSLF